MPLDLMRVDSVRRAAEALAADPGARFLAGGTILMRLRQRQCRHASTPGPLRRARPRSDRDRRHDGRRIGARRHHGGCARGAAARIPARRSPNRSVDPRSATWRRSAATCSRRSPYGDFAVALLALGGDGDRRGRRRRTKHRARALLAGRAEREPRIVTGVAFDLPGPGVFRFAKVIRRKPHGAAVLAIAAALPTVDGKLSERRASPMAPWRPRRSAAPAVERALEGRAARRCRHRRRGEGRRRGLRRRSPIPSPATGTGET